MPTVLSKFNHSRPPSSNVTAENLLRDSSPSSLSEGASISGLMPTKSQLILDINTRNAILINLRNILLRAGFSGAKTPILEKIRDHFTEKVDLSIKISHLKDIARGQLLFYGAIRGIFEKIVAGGSLNKTLDYYDKLFSLLPEE